MLEGQRTMNIVRALVSLAQGLNIDVIAEGVETELQLNTLRILGCHNGQGYYFAQPLELEESLKFLQTPLGN